MDPSLAAVPPPPPFKNRKTGLVIFGALTIALGGLLALFVPIMVLSAFVSAKDVPQVPTTMIFPGAAMYAVMAVILIWLGIGSIKARRWARALLLIFSWSALATGIMSAISMAMMSGPYG